MFYQGMKESQILRDLMDPHLRATLKNTLHDPEGQIAEDALHHVIIGDVLASRK